MQGHRWHRYVSRLWLGGVFLFFYMPLMFLVVFSFNSTRQDSQFTGFSLRWYQALGQDTRLVEGFLLSLNVALLSATLATVLATLAAYALIRFGAFKGRSLFNAMLSSPLVMPEVITGLSILLLFVSMGMARGMTTIWIAHVTFCFPFVAMVVRSRMASFNREQEEAASGAGVAGAFANAPRSTIVLCLSPERSK